MPFVKVCIHFVWSTLWMVIIIKYGFEKFKDWFFWLKPFDFTIYSSIWRWRQIMKQIMNRDLIASIYSKDGGKPWIKSWIRDLIASIHSKDGGKPWNKSWIRDLIASIHSKDGGKSWNKSWIGIWLLPFIPKMEANHETNHE